MCTHTQVTKIVSLLHTHTHTHTHTHMHKHIDNKKHTLYKPEVKRRSLRKPKNIQTTLIGQLQKLNLDVNKFKTIFTIKKFQVSEIQVKQIYGIIINNHLQIYSF